MKRCDVCGKPGEPLKAIHATFPGGRLTWVPAPPPGVACSPECATFVFVRPKAETRDELKLSAWRWRQRCAESHGLPFDEPCPMDEAERAMVVRMSMLRATQPNITADIERRATENDWRSTNEGERGTK